MSDDGCYYAIEMGLPHKQRLVWDHVALFPKKIGTIPEARRKLTNAQGLYHFWGHFRIVAKCPGKRTVIVERKRYPRPKWARKMGIK